MSSSHLLAIPTRDFDAVVAREGQRIARHLSEALPARLVHLGGEDFASYRLVGRGFVLDLWDRQGQSLESDLQRRDLTVNALALDVDRHRLIDLFTGLGDLEAGLLRAVTTNSFVADPLRALRLARLLAQLPGFSVVRDTTALAREAVHGLEAVANERVHQELRLILSRPEAHRGLALLIELGIYPGLWLGRGAKAGDPGSALIEMTELSACYEQIRQAASILATNTDSTAGLDLSPARWAILFVNLPATQVSPDRALTDFRRAGLLSRREADGVAVLLPWVTLPERESEQRRFLYSTGTLWPVAACYLGARSAAQGRREVWKGWLEGLVDLLRLEGQNLLDPPTLITGHDVQQLLGLGPGPQVGEALARIRRAQVEGRIGTREQALELLKKNWGQFT
jgi:tRNA nucleotidyltransferase (CCA-adding enzyme)